MVSPGTNDTGKGHPDVLTPLPADECRGFLSAAGLLKDSALDRPDVGYATKEIRQRVAKPDVLAMLMLKRVGRYLLAHAEVAYYYAYQEEPKAITCYTDADWAGEPVKRLST